MRPAARVRATALLRLLLGTSWLLVSGPSALAQAAASASPAETRVLEALRRGGVAVLVRHSRTEPGVGDPPGFDLQECSTQRNLSDAGREQARRLGRWFDLNGIVPTTVQSSPWCRTRETAMLAFGRSQDWVALSNLFKEGSGAAEQSRQVRAAIAAVGRDDIKVLVSHGVSIQAFVGAYLAQGELLVVRPAAEGVEVLGRWLVP